MIYKISNEGHVYIDGSVKSWEYIGNPISIPALQKSNINDFLYYKTGGRK